MNTRNRLHEIDQRAASLAIAATRISVGLLWLANLSWKRPNDFGKVNGSGLARWMTEGVKHPVFPPYSWFLEHVALRQLTLFGWFTLISETLLAVALILGWRTRWFAILGVVMSIAIAMSVLEAPNEWPWAYFLMIGIHLLLWAVHGGDHYGLDHVLPNHGAGSVERVNRALGGIALAAGVAGAIAAADDPFTAKFGSLVGSRAFEVKLFWFNELAALICIGIGVLLLASALLHKRVLAVVASALAGLCAVQVLAQWRGNPPTETGGILGGNGGTLALWLILGLGSALTLFGDPLDRMLRKQRS